MSGVSGTILAVLADGEWHPASELAHPALGHLVLEASVRRLRAEGTVIQRVGDGESARYRLFVPRSRGPEHGAPRERPEGVDATAQRAPSCV